MKKEIEQIEQYLSKYNKIFIFRHQRPDLDALGSQIGLYNILKQRFPNKEIYAYGDDDIKQYEYIGDNQHVNNSQIKNSLIFILDTANVDRIHGDYSSITNMSNKIIKIDHHPNLEPYGNINLVDHHMSSTSEYIHLIFIYNMKYELNNIAAKALFAGIYTDTGGFSYPLTSSDTFLAVSNIVKYKFDFEDLMLNIKEVDEEIVRVLGYMYSNIEITDGLGILKFDKNTLKKNNIDQKNISMLVNYLGIFKNIKAWILMVEYEKFIRVNLRSKKDIDVSKVAMNYEGGGHKNASGAKIYSWDESLQLIDELKQILQ